MKPKSHKLLTTSTWLIVCSLLTLGLAFLGFIFNGTEDTSMGTNSSAGVEFELGPGMGPNLMTPKSFNSNEELIERINAELKDEWIVGGQGSMTRRYMSALIAGEGCKSYVDYGDGIWVPIDDDLSDPIELDATSDPFGD